MGNGKEILCGKPPLLVDNGGLTPNIEDHEIDVSSTLIIPVVYKSIPLRLTIRNIGKTKVYEIQNSLTLKIDGRIGTCPGKTANHNYFKLRRM